MNWIIKPGSPIDDFVPYCQADKPSQCNYKDCAGAETYTCTGVHCEVLTCVAGGYTCDILLNILPDKRLDLH
jgi:hypothetical protein